MSANPTQYPGTLYDYTAGVYCGVLVTERVMRKLAALQAQHVEAVRRLLTDNIDEVFPSSWTLHYPDGKQTSVHFIDTADWRSAEQAIRSATHAHQPVARFPVFYAEGMKDAAALADARHAELSGNAVGEAA